MRFCSLLFLFAVGIALGDEGLKLNAYSYASDPLGPYSLGLPKEEAEAFAEKIAAMENGAQYLEGHKTAFRYAY